MASIDVFEQILRPMERLYGVLSEAWRDQYMIALEAYDANTLRSAWKIIVENHNFKRHPTISEIKQKCGEAHQLSSSVDNNILNHKNPAQKKAEKARKVATEYAAQWMRSEPIASLARKEEWDWHLREVVENIAWVQAQVIEGVRNIGIDALKLGMLYSHLDSTREYINKIIDYAMILTSPKVTLSDKQLDYIKNYANSITSPSASYTGFGKIVRKTMSKVA